MAEISKATWLMTQMIEPASIIKNCGYLHSPFLTVSIISTKQTGNKWVLYFSSQLLQSGWLAGFKINGKIPFENGLWVKCKNQRGQNVQQMAVNWMCFGGYSLRSC